MILKLGMKHQGIKFYKVYINHDPGMTLSYFTYFSSLVHLSVCVCGGGGVEMPFDGENLQEIGK